MVPRLLRVLSLQLIGSSALFCRDARERADHESSGRHELEQQVLLAGAERELFAFA